MTGRRSRGDAAEAGRVVNRPASVHELPLFGGTPAVAQPARVVEVKAHTRVVDGTKAAATDEDENRKRFDAFDAANPGVYVEIERRALLMKRDGATRISAKLIVELMRADSVRTVGSPYRFDNTFTAFYNHRLQQHPELAGVVKAKGKAA